MKKSTETEMGTPREFYKLLLRPGAVIGPLIDMKAVEKVEAHIARAVKKGAKVVAGGKRAALGGATGSAGNTGHATPFPLACANANFTMASRLSVGTRPSKYVR